MEKALTLYELNCMVADTIDATLARSYWVEAELSEVRENRGHCYMELIEKDGNGNVPVAGRRPSAGATYGRSSCPTLSALPVSRCIRE